jgi:hypothetical protein
MTLVNEAGWDRIVRVLAGVALLYVGWHALSGSTLGVVVGIVAFLPLLTGILGWCPAYSLVGIGTRREERSATGRLIF